MLPLMITYLQWIKRIMTTYITPTRRLTDSYCYATMISLLNVSGEYDVGFIAKVYFIHFETLSSLKRKSTKIHSFFTKTATVILGRGASNVLKTFLRAALGNFCLSPEILTKSNLSNFVR